MLQSSATPLPKTWERKKKDGQRRWPVHGRRYIKQAVSPSVSTASLLSWCTWNDAVNAGNISSAVALYVVRAYDLFSSLSTADHALGQAAGVLEAVRTAVLLPLMRAAVVLCLIMSVMLVIEKLSMALVAFYVTAFRRTPDKVYKWEPLPQDPELGSVPYPMVLVQIPMFNEREVNNCNH